MDFHFLWIIGGALLAGWCLVDFYLYNRSEVKPARSWYSVPVIGAVMCFMYVFIKVAQLLS